MQLRKLKQKARQENNLFEFLKAAWKVIEPDTVLRTPPYLEYQCNIAQKVVEHYIETGGNLYDIIVVNVVPGSSKSTLWAKVLPAWIWIKSPSTRIGNTSHDATLAGNHLIQSRDIILSEWYQSNWGHLFQLKYDKNTKKEYANDKSGNRKAFSVKGGGTGHHMDLGVIDDVIDVMQPVIRELALFKANAHAKSFITTRVKGPTFLIMQRASLGDTTEVVLKMPKKKILHICLPIKLSDKVSPIDARELYNRNGYLSDEYEAKEDVLKDGLTDNQYAAQYLQDPEQSSSQVIKKTWFDKIMIDFKDAPKDIKWFTLIDGAYTESTKNDPSGLMIAGYSESTNKGYIRHFVSKYMGLPELTKYVDTYYKEHNLGLSSKCYIEPKASGLSLIQNINHLSKTVSAVKIESDLVRQGKAGRESVAAAKLETGWLQIIKGDWNQFYIDEMTGKAIPKHDESIDLTGYFVDLVVNQNTNLYYNYTQQTVQLEPKGNLYYVALSVNDEPYNGALVFQLDIDNGNYTVNILQEIKGNSIDEVLAKIPKGRIILFGDATKRQEQKVTGKSQMFDYAHKKLKGKRKLTRIETPFQFVRNFINLSFEGKTNVKILVGSECFILENELRTIKAGSKGKLIDKVSNTPQNGIFTGLLDVFIGEYFKGIIRKRLK